MDSQLLTKYSNKWVALTGDRKKVITAATNIKDLDKKVKALKDYSGIIYHYAQSADRDYAFHIQLSL